MGNPTGGSLNGSMNGRGAVPPAAYGAPGVAGAGLGAAAMGGSARGGVMGRDDSMSRSDVMARGDVMGRGDSMSSSYVTARGDSMMMGRGDSMMSRGGGDLGLGPAGSMHGYGRNGRDEALQDALKDLQFIVSSRLLPAVDNASLAVGMWCRAEKAMLVWFWV